MKNLISLLLFSCCSLPVWSQAGLFNGDGYYRVQNVDTKRFMTIVDDDATIKSDHVDLGGFRTMRGFEDENEVVSNPATICYFDYLSGSLTGTSVCNLQGQGLDLYKLTEVYLNVTKIGTGAYNLSGKASGVTKYIFDQKNSYSVSSPTDVSGNWKNWYLLPVNQEAGQYFGVKPDVTATADGTYWATMYASFPFTAPSDMKVYRVSRVVDHYVVIAEITGNIPADVPLLIRCGGDRASKNKLTLLNQQVGALSETNLLKGNYYCNPRIDSDGDILAHHHVLENNPLYMRLLGVSADGKPAFVKSSEKYIPANKAYLIVGDASLSTLEIITEEEYVAGIDNIAADMTTTRRGVYSLSGVRMADDLTKVPKGVYVADGRKVLVK